MQSQRQRDEKTLVIATALGLFVLVLALGAVARWAASSVYDVATGIDTGMAVVIWFAAALIPIVYLLRSSRR